MTELINQWMPAAEQWIAFHREEMIRDIQEAVRIPSVSHPEQAVHGAPFGPECRKMLDHMLAKGAAYGFRTRNLDGWAGTVSFGNEEKSIGIIAHLDVVPVGDGWIYPPFEGTYLPEQDAIIGRGCDDNKGPAIAALFLMRMIRDLGIPIHRGIRLYCGVSEENGMMDMRHLRENGEQFPELSLVPDAGFPVNYGQKGSLNGTIQAKAEGNLLSFRSGNALNIIPDLAECEIAVPFSAVREAMDGLEEELRGRLDVQESPMGVRIRANGVSGHAASPDGSMNAIHLMCVALDQMGILTSSGKHAVQGLGDLSADGYCLSEGASFEDGISGRTTLVYSMAELKEGKLTVGLDCRYSITCDAAILRKKLEQAWKERGYTPEKLSVSSPFYIPKEDPKVIALQKVFSLMTGRDDAPYTMGGGTYSREVPNAISYGFGLPAAGHDLSFLPPGHGRAHGRDEILWMEKIETGMKIYLGALLALDRVLDADDRRAGETGI